MWAAILGWLGSKGVSLLLGFIANWINEMIRDARASKAQRDAGRAEAEKDQANITAKTNQAIAEKAAEELTEEDVLARMEKGEA